MNRETKKIILPLCILIYIIPSIVCVGGFFAIYKNSFANSENNVIISEIQISGENSNDEFVELHNLENYEVSLNGWSLKRKTKSGRESNVASNINGIIPPLGYFLIIPRSNCGEKKNENCYNGKIAGDEKYTTNSFFAKDNTAILYNDKKEVVDKVGWGKASDFEGEVAEFNPDKNQSLKRKTTNEIVQDTNNNKNDFFISLSDPKNSNKTENLHGNNSDNNNDSGKNNDNYDNLILITEFLPNPNGSDKSNEFIEIYNSGDKEISLSGWLLEDKIGKTKSFAIPSGTKIGPESYFVFYSDATKISLNNSGDGVRLKNKNGVIIDESANSGSAKEGQSFALNKNKKWVWTSKPTPWSENIIVEKIIDDSQKDGDKRQKKYTETENKTTDDKDKINAETEDAKRESGINALYNFSDGIIISEVYPNPKGIDNKENNFEWIELYNGSGKDVNLEGWKIDDIKEKGSAPYTIKNTIIKAGEFKIFSSKETNLRLNNFEEEVRILWPDNTLVDSVKYKNAVEGSSLILSSDESWIWSLQPTPNKRNVLKFKATEKAANGNFSDKNEVKNINVASEKIINAENDNENYNYIDATIEEAKTFKIDTLVKISGIVSVPVGTFSDKIFYISSNNGKTGIKIYSNSQKEIKTDIGDEISVVGKISEIEGEKTIILDGKYKIETKSKDNPVKPIIISLSEVGKQYEGCLVTIEGKISEIKNNTLFVKDGEKKVKIYINSNTKIKIPKAKVGNWTTVTGQLSIVSSEYVILPRFQNDIRLNKVMGTYTSKALAENIENIAETKSGKENKNQESYFYNVIYGIAILFTIIVFILFLKKEWKRKANNIL